MANVNIEDILEGVDSGIKKAHSEVENASDHSPQFVEMLHGVFNEWPREISPRFVKYFSEMVTIADISRNTFGYPVLNPLIIKSYLDISLFFFDSFTHK